MLPAERKAWHTKLHEAASKRDWTAYRAHKQTLRTREWEHYLLDDDNWQTTFKTHLEAIFKKKRSEAVAHRLEKRRHQVAKLCKVARWVPFTLEELRVTQAKWTKQWDQTPSSTGHSTSSCLTTSGPVGSFEYSTMPCIGHPPAIAGGGGDSFVPQRQAVGRTRGRSPSRPPCSNGLHSCCSTIRRLLAPVCKLQGCSKGRQLLAIRKVSLNGQGLGGGPFIIVKLNVKKAFDLASQCSMGDQVQSASSSVQTNGVRQGGPDSTVVFSALIGKSLQRTTARRTCRPAAARSPNGPNPKLPPRPTTRRGTWTTSMFGESHRATYRRSSPP